MLPVPAAVSFTLINAPFVPPKHGSNGSQTFEINISLLLLQLAQVSIMNNDADESLYDYKISGKGYDGCGYKRTKSCEFIRHLFP